mmetsp:Transcript_9903/g.32870  ORF Transcript_9903/g.32870 Transcript_9903/m.32870 type:complete len:88 (+) Transcript_9903:82-345(+)
MARLREKRSFLLQAMPFMFLMAAGSWGLSRFLRLPTQVKDDRARRRKQGRAKFDLQQEHEALLAQVQDDYENVRVPGPRNPNRKPAD